MLQLRDTDLPRYEREITRDNPTLAALIRACEKAEVERILASPLWRPFATHRDIRVRIWAHMCVLRGLSPTERKALYEVLVVQRLTLDFEGMLVPHSRPESRYPLPRLRKQDTQPDTTVGRAFAAALSKENTR